MAEDPENAWKEAYALRDYNPYRLQGQKNPAFGPADGRPLDLKDNKESGINAAAADFKTGLEALNFPKGTLVVIVPGHDPQETNEARALARTAKALAKLDDRYVPSVDSLIRFKEVEKKAKGGGRGIDGDLESIKVTNPEILKGKTVLIIDDTTTKGGSLAAARQLVEAAGANKVATVALARTVKYY